MCFFIFLLSMHCPKGKKEKRNFYRKITEYERNMKSTSINSSVSSAAKEKHVDCLSSLYIVIHNSNSSPNEYKI